MLLHFQAAIVLNEATADIPRDEMNAWKCLVAPISIMQQRILVQSTDCTVLKEVRSCNAELMSSTRVLHACQCVWLHTAWTGKTEAYCSYGTNDILDQKHHQSAHQSLQWHIMSLKPSYKLHVARQQPLWLQTVTKCSVQLVTHVYVQDQLQM